MKKLIFTLTFLFIVICSNAQWTHVTNGISSSSNFKSLAINGTEMLAGTGSGGVYYSNDNGYSWSSIGDWLMTVGYSVFFSDGYIYLGADRIWYTGSHGSSWWHKYYAGMTNETEVFSLTSDGYYLYMGTQYGVFYSDDAGTTIHRCYGYDGSLSVFAMLTSGSNIYAGGHLGVYRSSDYGSTWNHANTGLPQSGNGTVVLSLARIGSRIFAGTDGAGVYTSTNSGGNWTAANNGIANADVFSIVTSGASIIAGTSNGVYFSNNNGVSWSDISVGISGLQVNALTMSGTTVFAGTNNGVWKRSITDIIAYNVEEINTNSNFIIFPNPASEKLTVEINKKEDVNLIIYNLLGVCIYSSELVNQSNEIDISTFAKGIYVIRIIGADWSVQRKFVKE